MTFVAGMFHRLAARVEQIVVIRFSAWVKWASSRVTARALLAAAASGAAARMKVAAPHST